MTKPDVVRPYVEKLMQELLGVPELLVWDDGTIPVRVGSAGVYVRVARPKEQAIVHVYSPMLRGVQRTPQLLERLNEINATSFFARTFWADEQVFVAVDLVADALDKEELQVALDVVSGFADHWDTQLKGAFGGETAFEDLKPELPEGAPELPPPPGEPKPSRDAKDPTAQGYL